MGPFVDGIEAIVAVELLHLVLARVAVAAVHLDGQVVGGQAPLRRPALGDRRQDVEQQRQLCTFPRILGHACFVDQPRAVQIEGQCAFDVRLLRQQHAFDVGVIDDADLRAGRILAFIANGTALRPVARIAERMQIAGVAQRHCTQADADARFVHHVEHVRQAMMGLADQVSDRPTLPAWPMSGAFAEIQQAVDRAAVAHLVVDAGELHVVALAQSASLVDQELGHQQQRNSLHARDQLSVGPRDFRQHQMHDVLGQFVVAS